MTNTEKITALNETVLKICAELGCRVIFITYFDGGSGDVLPSNGPALANSIGISSTAHKKIVYDAWYEMDRACNINERKELKSGL